MRGFTFMAFDGKACAESLPVTTMLKLLVALCSWLCIWGCKWLLKHRLDLLNTATMLHQQGSEPSAGLVSSPNDKLSYRFITLPNSLRALLISDPETDKAAASMDVCAGSLLDTDDVPGLAHLTEHMLFYSSAKYPEEDDYSKFIQSKGGHTNAYTSSEDTNYSFDINHEHLAPALDRFAQFFIEPLISRDGVEREVNAVDSEHGKNLQTDAWRHLQVCKHVANPDHPWARFATGNLETLGHKPKAKGVDVRDAVVEFHSKYYSANLMKLAVLGRQSLDELQRIVEEAFSAVPNHDLPKPTFPSDVYVNDNQPAMVKVVPVKQTHACEWLWQVPPSTPLYKKAPLSYLSHLLGHEGEGSVYSVLRQRGWATSLVAGESGSSISSASFFYVRVEMTEEGERHVDDIGAIIFSYLSLLAREGIQEFIYQEVAALNKLRLEYRDKSAPYSYTTTLSSAMQLYPERDLLLALYHVPQEWDPECIRQVLNTMTVDQVRVCWTSQTHQTTATEVEPWYGTKFWKGEVPSEWLHKWRSGDKNAALMSGELHLPLPNPFIPTDLSLRSADATSTEPTTGPTILQEVPGLLRLWHRCDLTFPTPKAVLYADFQAPESYTSPVAAVCTRLLVKLLVDSLSELSYPASLADLHYDVSNSQSGFLITLSGYNHKLPVLLEAILTKLEALTVQPDRFAVMVEQLKREYHNIRLSQPYSWAMYRRELLLNMKRWQVSEYEQVLPRITVATLHDFKSRLLSQCFVEAMYVGNVAATEAQAVAGQLLGKLQNGFKAQPLFTSQMRDLRTAALPPGQLVVCEEQGPDPKNTNSAVTVMYQVGPDDPDLIRPALLELLVHMSKRDAFNILRTQQQLGYIVHMFVNHELGVHHAELLVQSNAFPPKELLSRLDGFIHQLCTQLLPARCGLAPPAATGEGDNDREHTAAPSGPAAAGRKEFDDAVEELSKALLEKPKRVGELASRWWNEVFMGTHTFNRRERLVAALKTLTPQQLIDFSRELLMSNPSRRKGVVAIHSGPSAAAAASNPSDSTSQPVLQTCGTEEASIVRVTDVAQFRRGQQAWPSIAGLYSQWRQSGILKSTGTPSEQPVAASAKL